MCIWPPGMSKKRVRTICSRSGDPSGTFQSGDPDPQRPSWVRKSPPWSAQGPLKGHPGGPRAPLDHPCEFHPCTVIFENLRFSSFTHISNVFSMRFDYHSCFTNFHLSHFTHISNVFSTIYQTTTFPRSLLWTLESLFGTPPEPPNSKNAWGRGWPIQLVQKHKTKKEMWGPRVAHTAGTETGFSKTSMR